MEIEIDILDHSDHDLVWAFTGRVRVVQLEVLADCSLDWVLDVICTGLNLGRKESWTLVWRDMEIGDYSKRLQELGIKEGDRLELIRKSREHPKQEGKSES